MSYVKQGRFRYHCTAVTPGVSPSQRLDLGSEILGGPTDGVETVGGVFGESEIGDVYCRVFVLEDHQNVFGLDVAVDDSLAVEVLEDFEKVLDESARVDLVEATQVADAVEEVAARHQLHDDVEVLLR